MRLLACRQQAGFRPRESEAAAYQLAMRDIQRASRSEPVASSQDEDDALSESTLYWIEAFREYDMGGLYSVWTRLFHRMGVVRSRLRRRAQRLDTRRPLIFMDHASPDLERGSAEAGPDPELVDVVTLLRCVFESGAFPEREREALWAIMMDEPVREYKQFMRRAMGRVATLTGREACYRAERGLPPDIGNDQRRRAWARAQRSAEAEEAYPLSVEEREEIARLVDTYTEPDVAWLFGLSRDRVRAVAKRK